MRNLRNWHNGAWIKWPTVCRRHFQTRLLELKILYFLLRFESFWFRMAGCWTGCKPLPVPMMTQFLDVYMCHRILVCWPPNKCDRLSPTIFWKRKLKPWWRHRMKHFPRYWPFVRSPVNSPHKGQWRGALMFPLMPCARINGWVNNREAGDLRRHRAH